MNEQAASCLVDHRERTSPAVAERPETIKSLEEDFGAHAKVALRLMQHIQRQMQMAQALPNVKASHCREHVLLTGLTGSGKTRLVRRLMDRLLQSTGTVKGCHVKCPELFTADTGATESRLARLLRTTEYQVIFLDDVDAIATRPSHATGSGTITHGSALSGTSFLSNRRW